MCVDVRHKGDSTETFPNGGSIRRIQADIRTWKPAFRPALVIGFPPCDDLAASGARWWERKGRRSYEDAVALADAGLALAKTAGCPYAFENPVGRLVDAWGPPTMTFDPCDYGDPWTKKTLLWTGNGFHLPGKNPIDPTEGSKMHRMSSTWKDQRSATPPGFARAVFEANVGRFLQPCWEVKHG